MNYESLCVVCGKRFVSTSEHKWIVTGHKKVCSYTCMNRFFEERSKNSAKTIERTDKDGNVIAEYRSISDAADKSGRDPKTVMKYLRVGYDKFTHEKWRRKNPKSIDKSVKT